MMCEINREIMYPSSFYFDRFLSLFLEVLPSAIVKVFVFINFFFIKITVIYIRDGCRPRGVSIPAYGYYRYTLTPITNLSPPIRISSRYIEPGKELIRCGSFASMDLPVCV